MHNPIKGVTLLELLTVIGIVVVLAVLLFPVLGSMRNKAFLAKSMANLRAIGQAYSAYMADNAMRPPEPLSHYTANSENRTLWEWEGWKGIGFGKLQFNGYMGISGGSPVKGENRSPVFFKPDPARRAASSKYENWTDYSYLLTGRYNADVWMRSSTAIAADVAGGVNIPLAQAGDSQKPPNALVLYTDGSTATVPYAIYGQAKHRLKADGFDRGAEAP